MSSKVLIFAFLVLFIHGAVSQKSGGDNTNTKTKGKCGNGEEYVENIPYCTPEDTCDIIIKGIIPDCPPPPENYIPVSECRCKQGYVRKDGECVSAGRCCTDVDPNSVLTPSCPVHCDNTCVGRPHVRCQLEPCAQRGCRCKGGYLRKYAPEDTSENNTCVKKNDCPAKI